MNCEYCGRFPSSETCAGCGSPNPYLHRGDPIRLRAGIDPRTRPYTIHAIGDRVITQLVDGILKIDHLRGNV